MPLLLGSSTTTLNADTPLLEANPRSADCHQPDGRVQLDPGHRSTECQLEFRP